MRRYLDVVYLDGDEGRQSTNRLYNVEGVVAHGMTAESIAAEIAHLAQWDDGERPVTDDPSWGGADDVITEGDYDAITEGDYVLSANLGLGYVALTRIIELSAPV